MNSFEKKIKVCAVIPFYNEELFVHEVVLSSLSYVDFVIAVNDGSIDGSEKQLHTLSNVKILSSERNMGKGFALQKGFDEALKDGFDVIITIDADKQHNPDFIPNFLAAINKFDIIIGNRLNNIKSMPFMRVLSNKITSKLLSLKTKQNIIDSQCGFRAYRREVLEIVKTKSYGYEAESEILILASKQGYTIGFENIPTIYENSRSKMRPLQAIVGFVKILLLR